MVYVYKIILEEYLVAQKERDMIEIDLLKLVLILWRKAWAIILSAIIMGGIAFGVTYKFIAPKYDASIKVYVNNTNQANTTTLTQSDLIVAKQLVETYIVTLESRTTLNQIITEAGLDYDAEELEKMISAAAINETEVFEVTVTSEDAKEAALIANTIADILPSRITEIVENSSVRIVDYAIINEEPVSPSYVKNVAIGVMAGIVVSVALIFLQFVLDNKIHSEEYLIEHYKYPILAVIPDLNANSKQKYYKKKKSYYSNTVDSSVQTDSTSGKAE
jgi:capsular polysaccharide biosynthesis protein